MKQIRELVPALTIAGGAVAASFAAAKIGDSSDHVVQWASQKNVVADADPRATACLARGMMTPAQAQRTAVVRIPGFLSTRETDELASELDRLRTSGRCGVIERDQDGQISTTNASWRTTYIHTGGQFSAKLPLLRRRIMAAALSADAEHWHQIDNLGEMSVAVRTAEYHEYFGPGGRLADPMHCDIGSLVTCDIMLADSGKDFCGGEFFTLEADGTHDIPTFNKGDAVLFVSHKYHGVKPVESGLRRVFVTEVWTGPEAECAHRCLLSDGGCNYSLDRAQLASTAQMIAALG